MGLPQIPRFLGYFGGSDLPGFGWRYPHVPDRHLGKAKTLSFGARPEVSLAEAREKRDAARKQVADGLDPTAEKKLREIRAQIDSSITFKSVAEEFSRGSLPAREVHPPSAAAFADPNCPTR